MRKMKTDALGGAAKEGRGFTALEAGEDPENIEEELGDGLGDFFGRPTW
jgi:hypothetical protein